MKTKTVYWNLIPGGHVLQESAEEKKAKGLEYVEKLKADGEKVIEVVEKKGRLKIILEDNG